MITHITYTDDNMTISAQKCKESAERMGYKSIIFRPKDIDKNFREKNKEILSSPRGAGYWLWKPYFIDRALKEIGGTILYADAGVEIRGRIDVKETTLYVHPSCIHGHWCKMDVLKEMGCEQFAEKKQLYATFMAFKTNDFNKKFVGEWLKYCQIKRYIDDSPSREPNLRGFEEHRYDQAILTNLAYKYDVLLQVRPKSLRKHGKRNPGKGIADERNNYIRRAEW